MNKTDKKRFRFSLSTYVLIATVLGLACGVFFGEYCAFLEFYGDAFVKLLQMTILPYIIVSLVLGIGSLTYHEAKRLATHVGLLMLFFWAVALVFVLIMPLSFPQLETASFFSTSMVEVPEKVDFLDIYIPWNPFRSMAENLVPAIVLFSILVGVALISIKKKGALLETLATLSEALIQATNLVVKLTPLGVFAITAAAAGTMTIEELDKLQVYLVSFNVAALLLTLWVLPKLLTPFTPFKYKDVVTLSQDALITAFATSNLFIVLGVLTDNCRKLFEHYELKREKTDAYVNVILPVSFTFPNLGKLLMLVFVLFGAWFAGSPLPVTKYPEFVLSGLLNFFGGIDLAMPFMLDLMKLPADLYQLYVATAVLNKHFVTLLAAMNLLVFTLLGTCALTGTLSIKKKKLITYTVATVFLTGAMLGGLRLYFGYFIKDTYTKDKAFVKMSLLRDPLPTKVFKPPLPEPPFHNPDKSRLEEIHKRGFIRVGYIKAALPFAFRNTAGDLVGFDMAMAHRLARDLNVALEFVLLDRDKIAEQLNSGYSDIIMSGLAITTGRARKMTFSTPYMDSTLAFIVKDYQRDEFSSSKAVHGLVKPRIGVVDVPYWISKIHDYLPQAKVVPLRTPRDFFKNKGKNLDALLHSAEAGSAWSLIYPEYTVVVPQPDVVKAPLAYPVARGDLEFVEFINTWIELKKKDRTIEKLYNYWILGQGAEEKKPRWSVARNILKWVE